MTSPNPVPPRRASRRRTTRPALPWSRISVLFILYLLIGLLLVAPQPPIWIWGLVVIAIPLLSIGLVRPMAPGRPEGRTGFLIYPGGFLLVIALSIALNYIGSDESFDNTGFFMAVLMMVALTLLAVGFSAAIAIVSALTGEELLQVMDYKPGLCVLLGTCFAGAVAGAIAGILALSVTSGVAAGA